ncbi:MAG: hypothetical protein RLZZ584_2841 [Pseudomonadota bacterium]
MRRLLARVLLMLGMAVAAVSAGAADRMPPIDKAAAGSRCVEPAEDMRRNHMRYLRHQRDATVRGGVRGAKHSLKDCVDCHASQKTGSVAKAETDFCSSCHRYAAVSIDCFECHTGTGRKPVAAQAAGNTLAEVKP